MNPREASCLAIAEEQYGVLTTTQAREAGLSKGAIRRRILDGSWELVCPKVIRVGGAPDGWRHRVMAACLAVPHSVVSHRTAAVLHGLEGFRAREVELLTTGRWVPTVPIATVRTTRYLPDEDVAGVDGIPATVPARTLLDLGSVCNLPVVRRAIQDAIGRRIVTFGQLDDMLTRAGRKGRPGTAAFRTILSSVEVDRPQTESGLEEVCLQIIRGAGFPDPVRQHPIVIDGSRKRLDLSYPKKMIAIEADGFEFHSSLVDFLRDRARQNALVALGWRVLRFTSADAKRPNRFLADLAELTSSQDGPFPRSVQL
ncbi:MAG: hypothetical protein GEU71_01740 [Actinobacteria bacterium]|nr:hypothetical protein [Actinomycetota bacterium]